jgi:hypothetical protein
MADTMLSKDEPGAPETFDAWLALGVDKGWISKIRCGVHEGVPMTEDEYEEDEPDCYSVVRVYGEEGPPEGIES